MSSRFATALRRCWLACGRHGRRPGDGASARDTGAAAVEFALVLPVLLLILFGIVDYGLYFSNSIQVRSSVHDATREFAVDPASPCTPNDGYAPPSNAPAEIANLMCNVHNRTASTTGMSNVLVQVSLPGGWAPGEPLQVCESANVSGLTGFVPLPGNGQLKIESVVSIEQDVSDAQWPDPTAIDQYYQDPSTSDDWLWCQ